MEFLLVLSFSDQEFAVFLAFGAESNPQDRVKRFFCETVVLTRVCLGFSAIYFVFPLSRDPPRAAGPFLNVPSSSSSSSPRT